MNRILVWQLAIRYLRGKRGANVVPILSRISMVAIAFSACAMIILLSVFNGMEYLVRDLYTAFYPEVKISAARGKFFAFTGQQLASLKSIEGINSNNEQKVAVLKGIERNYFDINNVRPYIDEGNDSVTGYPAPTTIAGRQLLNQMGIELTNAFSNITVYYPNPNAGAATLSPTDAFQSLQLKPDGAFRVQDEFDSKYLLASMPLVQQLLQAEGKYSSIEISLSEGADEDEVKKQIQQIFGPAFKTETRFEQNKTLYMVMYGEKWALYAILVLVLFIASFNMAGALSLLALEKQKNMALLKTMGATSATIRSIFITEGVLWSLVGGVAGLLAGMLICMGQKQFEWIKIQGSYIIEAYPVHLRFPDFLLIIITVAFVGLAASWFPAAKAAKVESISLKAE
jgi:lipoprotein-releasing system permease protein